MTRLGGRWSGMAEEDKAQGKQGGGGGGGGGEVVGGNVELQGWGGSVRFSLDEGCGRVLEG